MSQFVLLVINFKNMIKSKLKIIIGALIVIVLLGAVYYINFMHRKEELNCVRFRSGTISVEIKYPKEFRLVLEIVDNGFVSLNRLFDSKHVLNLGSNFHMYASVDSLLNTDKTEPGPVYQKTTINGFDAAYAQFNAEDEGVWEHYRIPAGNRVLDLDYTFSELNEDEKEKLEQIIRSMIIKEMGEDIKDSIVNRCY